MCVVWHLSVERLGTWRRFVLRPSLVQMPVKKSWKITVLSVSSPLQSSSTSDGRHLRRPRCDRRNRLAVLSCRIPRSASVRCLFSDEAAGMRTTPFLTESRFVFSTRVKILTKLRSAPCVCRKFEVGDGEFKKRNALRCSLRVKCYGANDESTSRHY